MRKRDMQFNFMYSNIAYLLGQDLTKYNLHHVEKAYFDDILEYLKDINEDMKSLNEDNQFSSGNLYSFYSIPDLAKAYEKHKVNLSALFPEDSKKERKEFFSLLYDILNKYYETKELEKETKNILSNFFKSLAKQYQTQYQFEKIETLPFDLDPSLENNSNAYAR